MRVEVLCTGDELLNGAVADTNSPFFMDGLLGVGERVARTTVVGDVRADIVAAFREACARSDVVLVCGGLGPTADDVTVEALAEALGVGLVEHVPTLEKLKTLFARSGRVLTPNNARQAQVPVGAEVVENPVGSAPMLVLRNGGCTTFVLPGVPAEYRALVTREVLPRIAALRGPGASAIGVRLLKTIGLPESHLDARVQDLARRYPEVTFGFRTVPPENHLKLTVTGPTAEAAERLVEEVAAACRPLLAPHLFAEGEGSLASSVLDVLRDRGQTVGLAESCTGGLVAVLLTAVPGASDVLRGGTIPYLADLKSAWLGVPEAVIASEGVVSAAVAEGMASGIRSHARTTWGLSITGYAGPGGGDDREPVGAVYIGLSGPDGTRHERQVFYGDRQRVQRFAAFNALDALRRRLLQQGQTTT